MRMSDNYFPNPSYPVPKMVVYDRKIGINFKHKKRTQVLVKVKPFGLSIY